MFRKLTEMVQRLRSLYVKGKVCLSLQAAALTLPRRKLPGQGFLNFSSCRQSRFLPLQRGILLQSRLINSLPCTVLYSGSRSAVPAVPFCSVGHFTAVSEVEVSSRSSSRCKWGWLCCKNSKLLNTLLSSTAQLCFPYSTSIIES